MKFGFLHRTFIMCQEEYSRVVLSITQKRGTFFPLLGKHYMYYTESQRRLMDPVRRGVIGCVGAGSSAESGRNKG
jgi:hypothetical protein